MLSKRELIAHPIPEEPKEGTSSHLQSKFQMSNPYSAHTSCSQQSTI